MKTITTVTCIRDPYFGRMISSKPEEIFKVFACYAKEQCSTKFDYEDWFGNSRKVTFRISRVILTTHNCFVEIEGSNIPEHYVPSPCKLIGKRYICDSHKRDFFDHETIIKEEVIYETF